MKFMKTNKKLLAALVALCAVSFAGHLLCYPALPETVPTHWGADGMVNGWGPKYMVLLLALLPLGLLALFQVLPGMDPKAENYEKFRPIWDGFVAAFTVFMAALSWVTELSVFGILPQGSNLVGLLVGGGLGLLFVVMGNYMPRVKQNYSFGCKTPWALADEHNWNRTQRMGGIVLVCVGLVMLAASVLAPALGNVGVTVLLVGPISVGVIWIYVYSYLVFRKILK